MTNTMGPAPDRTIDDAVDLDLAMGRVSFERSCLDMGWRWEVESPGVVLGGWLIRCSFQRPDRDSGEVSRGFGRWWHIARGTTVSGVAKTMFAAATTRAPSTRTPRCRN